MTVPNDDDDKARRDRLRDVWLSEMWPPVREVPREERAVARALREEGR